MNITLKKVQYSDFASQETHCFQADVYVDGVKAFFAENDGRGGCTNFNTYNKELVAYDTVNDELGKTMHTYMSEGVKREMKNDLELVVSDLLCEHLMKKDFKKVIKRLSYIDDGKLYQMKASYKPTVENIAELKTCDWWKSSYQILNEMAESTAFDLYKTLA